MNIHVIDDPTCACGHIRENNKHFLMNCPLFFIERTELLASLGRIGFKPTVKNLLFGNTQYSLEANKEAFVDNSEIYC